MPPQPPHAILPDPLPLPPISAVTKTTTYNYYGPISPSLSTSSSTFLSTCTNTNPQDAARTITAFLLASQKDCLGTAEQKAACWLTVRVSKPSDAFQVPRWHQDGVMFPYDEGREGVVRSKYALTLAGPRTLILEGEQGGDVLRTLKEGEERYYWWRGKGNGDGKREQKPSDEDLYEAEDLLRNWLAEEFKDKKRVSLEEGQVVRFSWGREDSPVHSEPDLVGDRVFVTVLFGSEREVRSMCEWRCAEYGKVEW
ncbi:hypothetical protein BCR34DRAFT_376593 [Clohesyomyces aquaticus]|uniref:Uncharacterized protein n=1 Tax=Clohesyomyces aquaticus TaxID=1231657 RepID=A0A1Y2A5W3_9PLEO|nr:hypothetical protein BCR34DRAFT_376593 [Clohesyomyces aquaticus]